jgi:hypothetical protein
MKDKETLVVGGDYDTRSRDFQFSVWVETVPVAPATAAALMRALQTVDQYYRYMFPIEKNELEFNTHPYQLMGWMGRSSRDMELDERDPLRYNARPIQCYPSKKTVEALNLRFTLDCGPNWIESKTRRSVFGYEAWDDTRWDERDEKVHYDERIRSDGYRLQMSRQALQSYLLATGFDLIANVEITRRNRGHDYSYYDKEGKKEATVHKIIILRKEGTIEAIEGRIGTWASPGP